MKIDFTIPLAAGLIFITCHPTDCAVASEIPEKVEAFLAAHCFECHDADVAKGDLNLADATFDLGGTKGAELWALVHDRVAAGEMPPEKKPRPEAGEKALFLQMLGGELASADKERRKPVGRTVLRRLNRTEYEYTLQDLFGLPELEVKAMLPPDGGAHGFDNVSTALDISYIQIQRYLDAADVALDKAMQLAPPPEPTTTRFPRF